MRSPNLVLQTDSYKTSHWTQYPPGTSGLYAYAESRGGLFEETVFFGLQAFLKAYWEGVVVRAEHVEEAEAFCKAHGVPFNRPGWTRVVEEFGGRLPVRIRAIPEGTVVPTHNVLMTVEGTDPLPLSEGGTGFLVSYLETALLRALWYPTTVATVSFECKRTLLTYLRKTSDDPLAELPFKLHDFGARGVSSGESAALGGMAHLVNFKGSDTIEGIVYANRYYGTKDGMAAFSIPAAEHSTITAWGREREVDAFRNMLTQFGRPGALVACVSDSYDLWNAIEHLWGETLREEVRKSGATLVIRPDSGSPAEVVLSALQILERKVGMTTNTRGYKVLPPYFRLIQGDGINHESLGVILKTLTDQGYSASNVAFGMGGGLLQHVNRDTQRFAYKCSEVTIDGQAVPMQKSPVTDMGKASRSGRLALVKRGGRFETVRGPVADDLLVPAFENGALLAETTLDQVRARAEEALA